MVNSKTELVELYKKVIRGVATEEEYHEYSITVLTHCMQTNLLLEELHKLANA